MAKVIFKVICKVCGRYVKEENIYEGMCAQCLKRELRLKLVKILVCNKCGKVFRKLRNIKKCPFCGSELKLEKTIRTIRKYERKEQKLKRGEKP